MKPAGAWALGAGMAIVLGAVALLAVRQYQPVPSSRQDAPRVRDIRALEPLRSGRIRIRAIDTSARSAEGQGADTIRYSLTAPAWRVEDAEIRGLLVGEPKYRFNQGTAYHMRLGRRFAGPSEGLYELKRGLVRWALPSLPAGSRIVSAAITFWVEGHDLKSPLARDGGTHALHLYAYPVRGTWTEGSGGRRRDNFSPAAEGEVTWTHAREGQERWGSQGGLLREGANYADAPVAVATITQGDRPATLSGEDLTRHVSACLEKGRPLDLLFKLEDGEEDLVGTELGVMTSQFGSDHDRVPKRPRLDLTLEIPGSDRGRAESFVLEPGSERELAPVIHPGATVVLSAEISGDGGIPPGVEMRGGMGNPSHGATWEPLRVPITRQWDWSQVRLRSPAWRVTVGDTISIVLHEFWVRPGPRDRQLPDLVLVAPSGDVHHVSGRPGNGDEYRLVYRPEEPGLWRFGWSFRTTPNVPAGSHQGEGIFHVSLPGPGPEATSRVLSWGRGLVEGLKQSRYTSGSAQARVNALCRWAGAQAGLASPAERAEIERLVAEARRELSR